MVIITNKRKREGVKFKIGNFDVIPKNSVKYLGVSFDTLGNFGDHIKDAVDKMEKLVRLMPRTGGHYSSKRLVLTGLLPAPIIWSSNMDECATLSNQNAASNVAEGRISI